MSLSGPLDRSAYESELAAADVFVCLRDPVLEAASASLIEEMATARPVVVYDVAHYRELPDDAVVKVDPGRAAGWSPRSSHSPTPVAELLSAGGGGSTWHGYTPRRLTPVSWSELDARPRMPGP